MVTISSIRLKPERKNILFRSDFVGGLPAYPCAIKPDEKIISSLDCGSSLAIQSTQILDIHHQFSLGSAAPG